MTHRQPKLPLALRIIAAGCVVLWLAGVSACNLESLFCCNSHGNAAVAHADREHFHDAKDALTGTKHAHDADGHHSRNAETHHSHDAEGHSDGSHKHDSKEGSCCSTLKAVVQTAHPVVISKPVFHPILFLCLLSETHAPSLALSENSFHCQAKSPDWVFTPGVCLGPAFRSLAPPAFI